MEIMCKRSQQRSLFLLERSVELERRRKLFGLFFIAISLVGIYGWETWGKEKMLYDDVLVLREDIERGTIITKDMLDVKRMDVDEDYLPFDERDRIIGMQASGFLHKGIPLFCENFENDALAPDEKENRYGLCIPTDWIASRPEKMTRGDRIFLFCGKRLIAEALISNLDKDENIEVIVSKDETASICDFVSQGMKLVLVCV